MKAYIAKNIMGVFAFDENGVLIERMLFPPRPEEIVQKLTSRCKEESMLERRLGGYDIDRSMGNPAEKTLNNKARDMAVKLKWVKSNSDYNKILSKVNILLTNEKLRVTKGDRILIQAIGVLDEMDRVINVFMERIREWYGLYFPEAEREVSNHERLTELVIQGRREGVSDDMLSKLAEKTAGMGFSDKDIEAMQEFAKNIKELFANRKGTEKYITALAGSVIPNMSAIAGPLLASRVLALAGGLEKISRMPSSSIQLLGAEKALFRHLKGGGRAPKYGILFSHPFVQQAPKERKGKMARLVAAKLSIAAKKDFFSKDDEGKLLKEQLENQVKNALKQK